MSEELHSMDRPAAEAVATRRAKEWGCPVGLEQVLGDGGETRFRLVPLAFVALENGDGVRATDRSQEG